MWQLASDGDIQGVWFWGALYTLLVCSYSLYFQIRTRYWPSVSGQLNSLEIEKFGTNEKLLYEQDYQSMALYTYHVNGVEYTGKRVSPWVIVASHNARFILAKQHAAIHHLPNANIKVFYNPNNPKKSFLVIASRTGIAITLAVAVLPLITFYWRFYG